VDLTLNQVGGADATLATELVFGELVNAQLAYQHYAFGGAGPFLYARAFYRDEPQDIYEDQDRLAQYDRQASDAELLVGSNFKDWGEVTFRYRWQHVKYSKDVGSQVLPEATDDVASLVLLSRIDTLDRAPFPRAGTRMEVGLELAQRGFGGDVDFSRGTFFFEQHFSPSDRDTLSVQARVGTALDTDLLEVNPGGVVENRDAFLTRGGPHPVSPLLCLAEILDARTPGPCASACTPSTARPRPSSPLRST
jgi:hypothetical protein